MSSIDRLVCHETPGATLLASLSGGRLVEVAVAAKDHADLTGAVILGHIERFVPELDAAFVDIGAARAGFLRRFPALAAAPLEQTEALEQLRAMWHGERIAVVETAAAPAPGVDTPADLERVRALWAESMAQDGP